MILYNTLQLKEFTSCLSKSASPILAPTLAGEDSEAISIHDLVACIDLDNAPVNADSWLTGSLVLFSYVLFSYVLYLVFSSLMFSYLFVSSILLFCSILFCSVLFSYLLVSSLGLFSRLSNCLPLSSCSLPRFTDRLPAHEVCPCLPRCALPLHHLRSL